MSLETSHIVPASREQVWQWHTQPGAIARLTPPFLPMVPRREAESLADGTTVFSMPAGLRWETRHDLSGYVKGYRFTEVCVASPIKALANWRHVHGFAEHTPSTKEREKLGPLADPAFLGGNSDQAYTLVTDEVFSRLPAATIEPLFAYRQQQLIGDFRFAQRLNAQFDAVPTLSSGAHKPLTIAITGARSNTGRALSAQLSTLGHKVIALIPSTDPTAVQSHEEKGNQRPAKVGIFNVKQPKTLKSHQRWWNPAAPSRYMLADVDVLIHAEGEDRFASPSTIAKTKQDSKASEKIQSQAKALIDCTKILSQAVADSPRCRTVIASSAIAAYGHDREELLTESAAAGAGRAAAIVAEWEKSFSTAEAAGARVVFLRTGEVLNGAGGILPVVRTLVSAGLGSSIAQSDSWLSWISQDDLTDVFVTAVFHPAMSGPINAVSPHHIRTGELAKSLRTQLRRAVRLPLPNLRPRALPGTRGQQPLALGSPRVMPEVLDTLGFSFRYPDLNSALSHELGTEKLFDA